MDIQPFFPAVSPLKALFTRAIFMWQFAIINSITTKLSILVCKYMQILLLVCTMFKMNKNGKNVYYKK